MFMHWNAYAFFPRPVRNWSIMEVFRHVLLFKPQKMCMSSIRGRLNKSKKSGSSLPCEPSQIILALHQASLVMSSVSATPCLNNA